MAFPVIVSSVAAQRTPAATSTSIAIPSGAAAGDLIVVLISVDIADPVTSSSVGWTRLVHVTLTETFAIFVARVGASPTPLVMTHGRAGAAWRTFLLRNVHETQAPEAAVLTQGAGLGATLPVPSITPTWGGEDALYLLGVMSVWPGNGPTTAPTGYMNRETSILGAATIGTEVDTATRRGQGATEAPPPWTGASALVAYASAIVAVRGVDSRRDTGVRPVGIGGGASTVTQYPRAATVGVGLAGAPVSVATIERPANAALGLTGAPNALAAVIRTSGAALGVGGSLEATPRGLSNAAVTVGLLAEAEAAARGLSATSGGVVLAGAVEPIASVARGADAVLGLSGEGVGAAQGMSDALGELALVGDVKREPRGIESAEGVLGVEGITSGRVSGSSDAYAELAFFGHGDALPSVTGEAAAELHLDGWGVTIGATFAVEAGDGLQLGGEVEPGATVEAEVLPDAFDLSGRGAQAPMMSGSSDGFLSIESRPAAMVRLFSFASADLMLSDSLSFDMMLEHLTSGGFALDGAVEVTAWDEAWPTCIDVEMGADTLTATIRADTLVLTAESAELTLEAEC